MEYTEAELEGIDLEALDAELFGDDVDEIVDEG